MITDACMRRAAGPNRQTPTKKDKNPSKARHIKSHQGADAAATDSALVKALPRAAADAPPSSSEGPPDDETVELDPWGAL
jgi:hypothetical protein